MKFHPALAAKLVLAAALLTPDAQAQNASAPASNPASAAAARAPVLASTFTPAPGKLLRVPTPRRCLMPTLDLSHEAARLGLAGYRKLSYQGRKTYASRCAQMLYFSACKGVGRYRVIVRYIRARRSVIAMRQGSCLIRLPLTFRRPKV